jgi:hypothetical protein
MSDKKVKFKKKDDIKAHPLYFAFCNAKSVALELARTIASESKEIKPDVRRFLDEFERKTV